MVRRGRAVSECLYVWGGCSGNMKPAGREWSLGVVRALVQRIISPMEQL